MYQKDAPSELSLNEYLCDAGGKKVEVEIDESESDDDESDSC